ncbi:PREDICTED: proteinase T-like [Amphimedon queenslandica]|uniref:Peptidase S8/S53 domain-containing protein n=1 Tax=Amphimedon queenslandica TaxID=400682 RepID=A0A1X7VCX5_AMPQE|nr:PREDICTED: proteinase T-like [Amphimedon queenslandica]|eukprot:XP_003384893.1 PREDICTED: proteinase T-like [Amphimedon queenslandica]
MKTFLVIAALIAVATAAVFTKKAPLYGDGNGAKEGDYIVVFQKKLPESEVKKHLEKVAVFGKSVTVRHHFRLTSLVAYSANIDDDALEEIRMMPEVRYVERNGILHATGTKVEKACEEQPEVTWGLARISKEDAYTPNDPYRYESDGIGEDVYIYIIDTGTRVGHVDYGGRAELGVDCYTSLDCIPATGFDANGHGTHVGSTAAGTTYGVAKKATIYPVKVLSDGGSGSYEQVVAGVVYTTNEKRSNPSRKVVANMSLGGPASQLLDDAVNEAVDEGVHMVVAAGNEFQDACLRSPARANGVTTVGATDIDDQAAYFTNFGECVAIFAPGVNIIAASGASDTATATYSGTSMASPHVAGVVASILSRCDDVPPADMEVFIKSIASKDKIGGLPPGYEHDNELAYIGCETGCPTASKKN